MTALILGIFDTKTESAFVNDNSSDAVKENYPFLEKESDGYFIVMDF